MRKNILFVLLFFFTYIGVDARGVGLIIIIEESNYTNEDYYYSADWTAINAYVQKNIKSGKKIIGVRNTPFTWFAVSSNDNLNEEQIYTYNTTKEILKEIDERSKEGYYVTSMGTGSTQKMYMAWSVLFTKKRGITDQVVNFLHTKKMLKWVSGQYDSGYRITEIAGGNKNWMVFMCQGTDIDRQLVCYYNSGEEFMDDIHYKWEQGYSVQLADCNSQGTYTAVYCTYKNGRSPQQKIKVCYNLEEAKKFIKESAGKKYHITRLGGNFWFTDKSELMGNIMGIMGSATNIMTIKNSNKGGGNSVTADDGGDTSSGKSSGNTCSSCKGSGKCSSSSGVADKHFCHGSGKCGYCGGKGYVSGGGVKTTCAGCNGSGVCKYCGGSGKCYRCKGTGKR